MIIKAKVYAKPAQLTVRLYEPIRLKCYSDENVRLSHIKWYRNGHKLVEEMQSPNGLLIERQLEYAVNHAKEIPLDDIPTLIEQLEVQMKDAAKKQEFEQAATYRDKIKSLRDRLIGKA